MSWPFFVVLVSNVNGLHYGGDLDDGFGLLVASEFFQPLLYILGSYRFHELASFFPS